MFTKEILEKLRKSREQALFIDGIFNPNNWNGGDDVIREFTKYVERKSGFFCEFESKKYLYQIFCVYQFIDDEKYFTITVIKDNGSRENVDSYVINYYKDRGTTNWIFKNGKIINEDEYIELLNLLEQGGFKFSI